MAALAAISTDAPARPQARGRQPAIAHPQRERAFVRPIVLQAARELFRERPSALVSMEQVAARAGVTRFTLGNHFSCVSEIFRTSRETMLHELSETICDEIPTGLDSADGLFFYLRTCCDTFTDPRNLELRFSLVHEHGKPSWLAEDYRRQVGMKLVRICETFLLYKSTPELTASGLPRLTAEQLQMFAASLTDRYLSALSSADYGGVLLDRQLQLAAKAYALLFEPHSGASLSASSEADARPSNDG